MAPNDNAMRYTSVFDHAIKHINDPGFVSKGFGGVSVLPETRAAGVHYDFFNSPDYPLEFHGILAIYSKPAERMRTGKTS